MFTGLRCLSPVRAPVVTSTRPILCRCTPRGAVPAATNPPIRWSSRPSPQVSTGCASCHPAPHGPPLHDTTVPVSCQGSGCHASATNLIPVHSALACADCHQSTDTLVTTAIATGNTACAACHPTPHGPPLHDTTVPATCQGSGCHAAATNLLPVHSALACADCHESSDPLVSGGDHGRQHCLLGVSPRTARPAAPRHHRPGLVPGLRVPRFGDQPDPGPLGARLRRLSPVDRHLGHHRDRHRQHGVCRVSPHTARPAAPRHHRPGLVPGLRVPRCGDQPDPGPLGSRVRRLPPVV